MGGSSPGGTGYAADLRYPYGYYVYGKTGTAQDNVDAWFCGYTQELSTCVWVGYPKEQTPLLYVEGVPAVYGGTIPAAIWHDYMLAAMDIYAPEGGDAYEHAGIHRDARAVGAGFEPDAPAEPRP